MSTYPETAMMPTDADEEMKAAATNCIGHEGPWLVVWAAMAEVAVNRLAATPTPPTLSEDWVPRIGDPVKVSDSCEYSSDWERTELWVSGLAVDEHCRGINVTVTEQWPVPSRFLRGYMGHTDGFLVARTDGKRDDLEPRVARAQGEAS